MTGVVPEHLPLLKTVDDPVAKVHVYMIFHLGEEAIMGVIIWLPLNVDPFLRIMVDTSALSKSQGTRVLETETMRDLPALIRGRDILRGPPLYIPDRGMRIGMMKDVAFQFMAA